MSILKVPSPEAPDSQSYAAKFDGSFYWETLEDSVFDEDFALYCWIKDPDLIGGNERLFELVGSVPSETFYVEVIAIDSINVNGTVFVVPGFDFKDGNWHQVSVWRSNGEIFVGVDGSQAPTSIMDSNSYGGNRLLFGLTTADRFLRADVYDIRYYCKTLYSSVILSAFNDMKTNSGDDTLPGV